MTLAEKEPGSASMYDHEFKSAVNQTTPSSAIRSANTMASNPQHALFCRMVGMPVDFETTIYPSMWNIFTRRQRKHKGLYPRVRVAYQWHTFQYWLVATMSNGLLWLQICFGAILTALGGLKDTRVSVVIMVLGALQTIYGGLITYFKSRNQPNRTRQYRIALKRVLDAIENLEEMFRDPNYTPPPYRTGESNSHSSTASSSQEWLSGGSNITITGVEGTVLRLMVMYMDAIKDAEANYPDIWVRTGRSRDQGQTNVMQNILEELKKNGAVQPFSTTAGDQESKSDAGAVPGSAVLSARPVVDDGATVREDTSIPASLMGAHPTAAPGPNAV